MITYILTIITLIGTMANSMQKKWCYYIWIPTNAIWLVYNIVIGQYAQAILYCVNMITSIIGLVVWSRPTKSKG